MREPRPGEKPSGLFEKTMFELGRKKWKLEPHEIELLRKELDAALSKRAKEWTDAWPNEPPPRSTNK